MNETFNGSDPSLADEEPEEQQFRELLRLQTFYRKEADRCRKSRAYFAGCVMLGAALEACLLGMVICCPDDIQSYASVPFSRGRPKPPLKWSLAELLAVAKEAEWLPAHLKLDEDFDSDRAHVGDYAEVVRMTRNLLHAGNYIVEYEGARVRKAHYDMALETLEVASDYLLARISDALRAALNEEAVAP